MLWTHAFKWDTHLKITRRKIRLFAWPISWAAHTVSGLLVMTQTSDLHYCFLRLADFPEMVTYVRMLKHKNLTCCLHGPSRRLWLWRASWSWPASPTLNEKQKGSRQISCWILWFQASHKASPDTASHREIRAGRECFLNVLYPFAIKTTSNSSVQILRVAKKSVFNRLPQVLRRSSS